jgi:hypothetical protein
MRASDKETAPRVSLQANTRRALTTEVTVIHEESSAHYAHPSTDETPCACYEGLVYIGHLVQEEGEEVEVFEAMPCRRCSAGKEL